MTRFLAALLLFPTVSMAEPKIITLTQGIVCKTIEESRQAFNWATENPEAEYVDLSEHPGCLFINSPVIAVVDPVEVYENDVAAVLIGTATPRNGDTRYIWIEFRLKTVEQGA